jgi:hypothetical protein
MMGLVIALFKGTKSRGTSHGFHAQFRDSSAYRTPLIRDFPRISRENQCRLKYDQPCHSPFYGAEKARLLHCLKLPESQGTPVIPAQYLQ